MFRVMKGVNSVLVFISIKLVYILLGIFRVDFIVVLYMKLEYYKSLFLLNMFGVV